MYDPCKHFEKWIRFEDVHLCAFPNHEKKFAIAFNDGSAWLPHWKDLVRSLKYSLRTEMFNRDVWRHGWPRRYFVKEIVGILNDEGYDVREFHQGKHTPEYLHEFYVEAVAPDGTGFGDVVIVRENNFARAKREARQKFEENTRERVKKTRWANDVIKIVDMHRKTYKLVESDYEVVEKEESGF